MLCHELQGGHNSVDKNRLSKATNYVDELSIKFPDSPIVKVI